MVEHFQSLRCKVTSDDAVNSGHYDLAMYKRDVSFLWSCEIHFSRSFLICNSANRLDV